MTTEEKVKVYLEDLKKAKDLLEKISTELKEESEDERIRKELIAFLKENHETGRAEETWSLSGIERWIAWLEKQKEQKPSAEEALIRAGLKPYKDGNQWCILAGDNIQEGICGFGDTIEDALCEFLKEVLDLQRKQKPAQWNEEDEKKRNLLIEILKVNHPNDYFKVNPANTLNMEAMHVEELVNWLTALRPQPRKEIYQAAKHDLAIKFMNYLDNNKPEGKMCLSNGECEDIDKAFEENDWAKIIRYAEKYQIQKKQKPETKLTRWVARDENGEIYAYEDYPEKDSEMWIGSNSMNLDRKSFPDIKWEDEPMEVEITIRKK